MATGPVPEEMLVIDHSVFVLVVTVLLVESLFLLGSLIWL